MLHQVRPVKFRDIPNGSCFVWASEYGSGKAMRKTTEDTGNYNAVFVDNPNEGLMYDPNALVNLIQE